MGTLIAKRLRELYRKCEYIARLEDDYIIRWGSGYSGWLSTEYGDRRFIVGWDDSFIYNDKTDGSNIFKIQINWGRVKITPIVDLTAQEIDLAILEIETKVERLYQRALNVHSKHRRTEKYFNKQ